MVLAQISLNIISGDFKFKEVDRSRNNFDYGSEGGTGSSGGGSGDCGGGGGGDCGGGDGD